MATTFFAGAFLAGTGFASAFFAGAFFSNLSKALESLSINFSLSASNLSNFFNNCLTTFFWLILYPYIEILCCFLLSKLPASHATFY